MGRIVMVVGLWLSLLVAVAPVRADDSSALNTLAQFEQLKSMARVLDGNTATARLVKTVLRQTNSDRLMTDVRVVHSEDLIVVLRVVPFLGTLSERKLKELCPAEIKLVHGIVGLPGVKTAIIMELPSWDAPLPALTVSSNDDRCTAFSLVSE